MGWRRTWIWKHQHKTRTTYSVQWLDDTGRRRTQAVGPDKKLADALRKPKEMNLNSGTYQETVPIRLRAFAEEHLRLVQRQVSAKTVKEQRTTLSAFAEHCGDVPLEKVTPKLIEAFMADRLAVVKPATVNKNLRTLAGIFQSAIGRGYLKENPFRKVKPAREVDRDARILTSEEVDRLLSACPDQRWRCFVLVALTTGMRHGELVSLEWSDVDLDEGLIHVRCKDGYRTKSGKNRSVPLLPGVAEALMALKIGSGDGHVFKTAIGTPWRNNVRRGFMRILQKAGIKRCTVHDLRKTFTSQLANAGENEGVVQRLAGHASMATTLKHYTRILPETLRRAPTRLPYAKSLLIVTQLQREPETPPEAKTA